MTDLKTLTIVVHETPEFVRRVLPDLKAGDWREGPSTRGGPTMIGSTDSDDAFAAWQAALDTSGVGYEIPEHPADLPTSGSGQGGEHGATSIGD